MPTIRHLKLVVFLGVFTLCSCGGGGGGGGNEENSKAQSSAQARTRTCAADTDPIRVLPIGDSITEADRGHSSYRRWLWNLLLNRGCTVDFIGTRQGVHDGPAKFADFDQDHEGYWGRRAEQILGIIVNSLQLLTPDIALLHMGTNDIFGGQSADGTLNEISLTIDFLRIANPKVVILLAQVIPSSRSSSRIDYFDSLIPSVAQTMSTEESPIIVVDHRVGFSKGSDLYDGIHPNDSGEQKMAHAWFAAMQPYLD